MKINSLRINAYGKLKNKELNLHDGINIIQGENESGKSTLLHYIIDMLYGISKTKDGKDISDFEKYKPWTGDEFSGRIEYSLDDGKKYEVFRDFKSKNPKIYNERMEDVSDSFDINKKEGNRFFTEQTKVDRATFLSTVVSMQQEVRLEAKDQNVLVQKMANMVSTGEDNISYKKANEKLQNKIRDEIGTSKTTQKPINILRNQLENIDEEIIKIIPSKDRKYKIDKEKEECLDQILKEEKRKDIVNKLINSKNDTSVLEQKIKVLNDNKSENEKKLNDLEKQKRDITNSEKEVEYTKDNLKIKQGEYNKLLEEIENNESTNSEKTVEKNRPKLKNLLIYLGVIVLFIANQLVIKKNIINIVLIMAIILKAGYDFISKIRNDNKKKKCQEKEKNTIEEKKKLAATIESEINDIQKRVLDDENIILQKIATIDGMISLLNENNEKLNSQIEDTNNSIKMQENLIRENIVKENEKVEYYDIEDILEAEDLNSKLKSISDKISTLKNYLNKLELEESMLIPMLERLISLNEQKENYENELDDLSNQANIINLAIDNLKEAYEEMKNTITPKFTKQLSDSIKEISNGKYTKVSINDEKGMIVENENGEFVDINKLSVGTIDAMYLALRLSMIEELSDESLPIILDETFAYFDEQRLQASMKFLEEKAGKHQVIIFTCRDFGSILGTLSKNRLKKQTI